MIRNFSRRYMGLALCFLSSLFFLLVQGGKLSSMFFVMTLILSGYLLLGKWNGISMAQGARSLLDVQDGVPLYSGSPLTVQIQLKVPGFWPIPYVVLQDRLLHRNGKTQSFEASVVPDWKRMGTLRYTIPMLKRGFYSFGDAVCSTEDLFGLFHYTCNLQLPYSFSVQPKTVRISKWKELGVMFNGGHHFSTSTRPLRETTQINGVREFQYGDRLSRIHWRATARTGNLKSKEFEREFLPRTMLVMDRSLEAYSNDEQFELAVSVAASIVNFCAEQDLVFGMLSVGAESSFFQPRKQSGWRGLIQQHLLDVEADGTHPLLDVLIHHEHLFTGGTVLVVISSQADPAAYGIIRWAKSRQMHLFHLLVTAPLPTNEFKLWQTELRSHDFNGYTIHTLAELPLALGGDLSD
ncbi:MAG: hypothetical protein JWN30_2467 [Bacilli bacterium]|nr:hypothetical protein [Bacilli bacterium]